MCPFIWCVFNDTPRHYASIPAYIPGVHPGIIPHTIPDVYPRCVSPVCIPGVHPSFIRRAPDVHSVLHLRSILTFGQILPRILEQVLCPRCSTFISIFITFIPFHSISMFERFMICIVYLFILCVFNDTPRHYASIPAYIPGVHPRCASRHNSGTQSVLYLRSNLTFGQILPRILEQVLCPRYSTFYPFLLLSFHFIPYRCSRDL
jgi:hypothetical protein